MKAEADRPPDASNSVASGVGTKPPVVVHLEHLISSTPREIHAEQWTSAPQGYRQGGYPRGGGLAGMGKSMRENEKEVEKAHALYQDALQKHEFDNTEMILLKHSLKQGVEKSGSSRP
ncbi:hypothetical protein ACYOEI_04255 [Singulisphaera rosea]